LKNRHQRTLWALTRGQRLRYGAAALALGLSQAFLLGVPLIALAAIDGILGGAEGATGASAEPGRIASFVTPLAAELAREGGAVRALWIAAGFVVVATGLAAALQYLRGRWAAIASEGLVRRLRERLFGHLHHLPCSFHDRSETGDVIQRCTSDVETVRVFLSAQVVEIGRSALLLAWALPVMLSLDRSLALVSLVLYPVVLSFAVVFFRRVQTLFEAMDQADGRMTAVLQENLTGIRVVRAFGRQDLEERKFADANADFRDKNRALLRWLATYWGVSDLICTTQVGLVLVVGARWAAEGSLTTGTLVAFLMMQAIVIWPVRQLGRVLIDSGKALVALRRLGELLDEAPEADPDEPLALPSPLNGAIRAEGLEFEYLAGRPVLRGLDLEARPGETVALVGPPGSGKSAFLDVLLRLYDATGGALRVDDVPVERLNRSELRARVGVVLQEPFLYSRTVEENVRLGRVDARREQLVTAAQDAALHDAIQGFDEGWETPIGERGVTLSGGQRQRLALARVLLRDPDILILDDALSAVDAGTEEHILAALRERRGRRTTILIAHRLSTVLNADRIVVLADGRAVQTGTHDELLAQEGPYRRLFDVQGEVEEEYAVGGEGGAR
jgi:ATP-binding cassette subfamily B protein